MSSVIYSSSAYTLDLAYAEVESLTPDNITKGMDGELWLNIHRKKTKKDYQVPLLPRALEILDKYKNHPLCLKKGKCLAVPSNVKYNAYLKEIGDIAGIPKNKPLGDASGTKDIRNDHCSDKRDEHWGTFKNTWA